MLQITESDVLRLFPMADAVECMRQCFHSLRSGDATNQPRRRLLLPNHSTLHQLAGSIPGYFGAKIYSTNPRHGAWFTVLLYEEATGKPLAEIEANHLGQIRTGAVSGLATDLLTSREASTLGIIGSGFQARTQLEAVAAVRKLTQIDVWSRDLEKRQKFAEEASQALQLPVKAVDTAEEAVSGKEIVVTATYAREAVVDATWIRQRPVLINAMGSNYADRRELPSALVLAADALVLDDLEQGRMEAGDFVMALSDQEWNNVKPLASYTSAQPAKGLTIFKSVGLGVEDVAAGALVYQRAILEH